MRATLGGLFAGLIAGVVTVGLLVLMDRWHSPPNAGKLAAFGWLFGLAAPFGIVISIYFWFCFRDRISAVKVIAFLICCGIANTLAWFAGVGLGENIRPGNHLWAVLSIYSRDPGMAIGSLSGGMVGAIIIAAAAIVLFSREEVLWSIARKALASSIAGGLLGVLGWELGSHLDRYGSAANPFVSLFLVWQAGVGLLLGFLLRHRQSSPAIRPVTK